MTDIRTCSRSEDFLEFLAMRRDYDGLQIKASKILHMFIWSGKNKADELTKDRAHAVAAADADRAAANVAEYPEADIDPKNCDIDPGAARPLEPRGSALHSRLRDAARRGHRLGFAVYAGPSHRAFAFADRGF